MRPALIAAFLCLAIGQPAMAIEIVDYDPVKHNRFSSGYSSNPVNSATPNTSENFIGIDHDWSGVIWHAGDRKRSYVLVSRRHYIFAAHFGAVETLQYHSLLTGLGSASRLSGNNSYVPNSDIGIGRLTQVLPASAGLPAYPLLDLPAPSSYTGQDLLVYGWNARVGRSKIPSVHPDGFHPDLGKYHFLSEAPKDRTDFVTLVGGDSGSPNFIEFNGQLALVGNNYVTLEDNNKNYAGAVHNFLALPEPVAAINNALAVDGFALRFLSQPAKQFSPQGSPTNRSDFGQNNNWSPPGAPTSTQTIGFDGGTNTKTINLNDDRAVRGVRFTGSEGQTGYTFSAGHTLTVNYVGIANDAPATQTFNCNMALADHQHWTANSSPMHFNGAINLGTRYLNTSGNDAIHLSGPISGSGGLSVQQGTTILNGSAGYTGKTYLYGGTMEVASNGQLPASSPLVFAGGTLLVANDNVTTGPASLLDHSSIQFQSGSASLQFAASDTETWRPNRTLLVNGFAPETHSLQIGANFADLSPAKRSAISFEGTPAFHTNNGQHQPATPYQQWALQHFPTQAGNPDTKETLWGANASPAGDDITNLVKFALNLNPSAATPIQLPPIHIDEEGRLVMEITKNNAAVDVVFTVEVSSDLLSWQSGPGHTEILVDDADQLIVRDTTSSTNAKKRFMRLYVSFAE